MKTAREHLAHLGIDESHPGPWTYQELLEAAQAALDSDPEVVVGPADPASLTLLSDEQLGRLHNQVEPGSDAHYDIIMEHCNRGLTS